MRYWAIFQRIISIFHIKKCIYTSLESSTVLKVLAGLNLVRSGQADSSLPLHRSHISNCYDHTVTPTMAVCGRAALRIEGKTSAYLCYLLLSFVFFLVCKERSIRTTVHRKKRAQTRKCSIEFKFICQFFPLTCIPTCTMFPLDSSECSACGCPNKFLIFLNFGINDQKWPPGGRKKTDKLRPVKELTHEVKAYHTCVFASFLRQVSIYLSIKFLLLNTRFEFTHCFVELSSRREVSCATHNPTTSTSSRCRGPTVSQLSDTSPAGSWCSSYSSSHWYPLWASLHDMEQHDRLLHWGYKAKKQRQEGEEIRNSQY